MGSQVLCEERFVENFQSYYNFSGDKTNMWSTVFSDLKSRIQLKFKDRRETKASDFATGPEEKFEIEPINFQKLLNKKKLVDSYLEFKPPLVNFCHTKKAKCNNCILRPEFSFAQIKSLTKIELLKELFRHGHPKSRLINKKQRTVQQIKDELIDHYKTVHFMNS